MRWSPPLMASMTTSGRGEARFSRAPRRACVAHPLDAVCERRIWSHRTGPGAGRKGTDGSDGGDDTVSEQSACPRVIEG